MTSSYIPVKPFPSPPADPVAIEIEEFVPSKGQFNSPHSSYVNNLYVYPVSLKYDSQKSFTKVCGPLSILTLFTFEQDTFYDS